jgi:hypothetical protein
MFVAGVWIARLVGCLLIYAAVFLRKDEEGQFQNLLETWVMRLAEKRTAALSTAARFTQAVAKLAARGFDRVFGTKLLSIRAIGVSISFSLTSFFLFAQLAAFLVAVFTHKPPQLVLPLIAFFWATYFFVLGAIPAFLDRSDDEPLWLWKLCVFGAVVAPIALMADAVMNKFGDLSALRFIAVTTLLFALSFSCDVLFIALTRWMLRKASEMKRLYETIGIILLNSALGLCLFYIPISLGLLLIKFPSQRIQIISVVIMMGSALNFVDILACSVFLLLLLFILLHRLVWPIIERPVYACARYGVINNKTLLWLAGSGLILAPEGPAVWKLLLQLRL